MLIVGTWSHKNLPPEIAKAIRGSLWPAGEVITKLVEFVATKGLTDELTSFLTATTEAEFGGRRRRNTRSWPEYAIWNNMRQRCENQKRRGYHYYGGRGIKVCERWQTFENFFADMGPRPDGLTLEREDNNGNYEPGNCRWATRTEQNRNRRNVKTVVVSGEEMVLTDALKCRGVHWTTLNYRVRQAGMTYQQAIDTPVRAYGEFKRLKERRKPCL